MALFPRHTQTQQQKTNTSAFTSVFGRNLQRQCACGNYTIAGAECAECRQKRLGLQHRAASQAEPVVVLPIIHDVLRSPGQPLDPATRAFMEPRFGHDFSRVRVHTDAKAAESARAVNALAYTVGQDVIFGAEQYQPRVFKGEHLLAHELTHTLQQEDSRKIRRKILLGGKYYIPKRDYNWIGTQYGAAAVEYLKSMHNDGKPPEFLFKDYAHMHYEVRVRSNAIKGMEKTATTCCSYPSRHPGGYLDRTYWDKRGPYHFVVKLPLPSGKNAADAVETIFQPGAGTELECNSMMVSVQYYSILRTIGKTRFNKRFPGGRGIVIEPIMAKLSEDEPNTLLKENLYERKTISGFKDLLPGDWVFFRNVPDYPLKHPGGNWTGEHALYTGEDKFSGFGLTGLTNDQMIAQLLEKYNLGLPDSQKKGLKDVPGIVPQVIRRPVIESYAP